jgi:hypothetical protein
MEVTAHPDVIVEFIASGVDYNVGPGGIANPINASRGDRGGVLYAQGTVTVDLVRRDPKLLVWEGIYHDDESNGSKLAQSLPSDVKKLLSKYPPRK